MIVFFQETTTMRNVARTTAKADRQLVMTPITRTKTALTSMDPVGTDATTQLRI